MVKDSLEDTRKLLEGLTAADNADRKAHYRGIGGWVLILFGISIMGALALTEEGNTYWVENVKTVKVKSNGIRGGTDVGIIMTDQEYQLGQKHPNVTALPLPTMEPFNMSRGGTDVGIVMTDQDHQQRQQQLNITALPLPTMEPFNTNQDGTDVGIQMTDQEYQQKQKHLNITALPLPTMDPFNMSQYETIHLWHLRKAGGTTLRTYFENIAKHHNLTFKVDEGMCYRGPRDDPKTLLVTMLKDPVARIESEYWGEGSINLTDPNSFMDWVDAINSTTTIDLGGGHWFVWSCTQNCLTKVFGNGLPSNLTKAKNALENDFDLIVQSNRMSDPIYQQWLGQILGAPEVKMPHRNPSDKKLVKENRVAAPKEADFEVLRKFNQMDYDLLKYLIPRRKDLEGVV
ncbi:expressed unknown protein [Seminavis robusta]|uniref:Uncharacterized protein n=1 Tax=Seminavis robusta TaxID=568900 RepID=A0A9N8E2Q3_9STRA|nr:expressed unknown protein [Seminavis robusta]|eukprot:Sro466_g148800.1 n/a (401) ;mRNA; r:32292-33494